MFRVSYLSGPHKAVRHRDFVSLEDALQYIRKRFLTGLQQIKLIVLDEEAKALSDKEEDCSWKPC